MARDLENQANVQPPSADYPSGRIKNDSGIGDGTPVSEALYGDIQQFFAKLLRDASITANGLPDNTTNGFQLNEALKLALLGSDLDAELNEKGWQDLVLNVPSVITSQNETAQIKKTGDLVEVRGLVLCNLVSIEQAFSIPLEFRPNSRKNITVGANISNDQTENNAVNVEINTNGNFDICIIDGLQPVVVGNLLVNLDGVRWWVNR